MLVFDQAVRAALRGGFKPELIRNAALGSGMRRMQDDAFEKLFMGVTTLEEILRVVPVENVALSECTGCGHELLPAFQFCPYCGIPRGAGDRSQKPPAAPAGSRWSALFMKQTKAKPEYDAPRSEPRFQQLSELHLSYEGGGIDIPIRAPDISVQGMFVNLRHIFPKARS